MPSRNIKTEFNATLLDYQRLDITLQQADYWCKLLSQRNNQALEPYMGALKALWINLKPIIESPQIREKIMKDFEDIQKDIAFWLNSAPNQRKKFQYHIRKKLETLHFNLMEIRQNIGMGIKTYREKTLDAKLKERLL